MTTLLDHSLAIAMYFFPQKMYLGIQIHTFLTSLYCLAYESTKIGHIFRDKEGQKWKESKNVNNEKCQYG